MNYTSPTPTTTFLTDIRTALQDPAGVRWSDTELVGYINRAQVDIQRVRPDTTAVVKPVTLRSGVRQALPSEAASLIDIPNNSSGGAVTKVNKLTLDAVDRQWRSRDPSAVILHFMHDLRTPRQFDVYPPAAPGARVDMEFSAYPTPVVPQAGGFTDLTIAPQWLTALYHLVLFYAWAKDAEFAANATLAAGNLSRAEQILGTELQTSATVAPKD